MKIELTPDVADWVEAEVAAGRFLSAEEAVNGAIRQWRAWELRAKLDAAITEGGSHTSREVLDFVGRRLDANANANGAH